jgi:hypothetical protein
MAIKIRIIFLSTLMLSTVFVWGAVTESLAMDYNLKLVANQSALESELEAIFPSFNSIMTTGISGVYQSDDYKMLCAKALIGNEIFVQGLTGGLGLKAALGQAEKRHVEDDIATLGFTAAVSYDLSKEFGRDVPVTLLSSLTLAPQPLCFSDTDKFFEFLLECDWKVLEQAAVVASYRYLNIDFENDANWEKINSTGYIGLKLFF